MLLSILIPCLSFRPWKRVVDEMHRQIAAAGLGDDVEVLTHVDDGQRPHGDKRQGLVYRAAGAYLAHFDDDDEPAPDYVASLAEACRGDPDLVTFRLRRIDRAAACETSWAFGLWPDGSGLEPDGCQRMAANHLCVWRATLAKQVAFAPWLDYGADQLWYKPLHAAIRARGQSIREVHLPSELYRYLYDPSGTKCQGSDRVEFSRRYFGRGLGCYWRRDDLGGGILIEQGELPGIELPTDGILVRNADNTLVKFGPRELRAFHYVDLV